MDVLNPPLITLKLTDKEGQVILDMLVAAGEQNVIFMTKNPKKLRWQLAHVKANHRIMVAIYNRINEQMKSLGFPVEYWREV